MSNIAFRYGASGLKGLSDLAELDARRKQDDYEQRMLESEYKSAALGNLAGAVVGGGMNLYQKYRDDKTPSQSSGLSSREGRDEGPLTRALRDALYRPSILDNRDSVDYAGRFSLDSDFEARMQSALSRFPSRFFAGTSP